MRKTIAAIMILAGLLSAFEAQAQQKTRLTVEQRSCRSRIDLLSELEKNMEGFARATRIVMQASERGILRGVHAPVGQVIRAADRYALAVETALGGAVGNVIVDTQNDGKAAIEYLKKQDGGRTTFQPIDTVRPLRLRVEPKGEPGYLGIASDLVECDAGALHVTLINQCIDKEREPTTMCEAHAHHGFIHIQPLLAHVAVMVLVDHVVVHFVSVNDGARRSVLIESEW